MAERRGRSLERVTRTVEQFLSNDPNAAFECPGVLIDRITGQPREFDVLITGKVGSHVGYVGIEAKDWSDPVDVGIVEGFGSKCVDTGVHVRIIVSSSGFYEPALTKAQAYNIRCMTIDEVDGFSWNLMGAMVEVKVILQHGHIQVTAVDSAAPRAEAAALGVDLETNPFRVVDHAGKEVSAERMLVISWGEFIAATRDQRPPPATGIVQKVRIEVNPDPPSFIQVPGGGRHLISHLDATFTYDIVHTPRPFESMVYRDADGNALAEMIVSAPTEMFGKQIRMAIVGEPNGGPKRLMAMINETPEGKKERLRQEKAAAKAKREQERAERAAAKAAEKAAKVAAKKPEGRKK